MHLSNFGLIINFRGYLMSMKENVFVILAAIAWLLPSGFSQSRVTFTENFNETTSSFTYVPQNAWIIDSNLSVTGKSAWGIVPNSEGDSIELVSPIYDLKNYSYVYLRFSHICKVSDSDLVTVEYRENLVGSRWVPVSYLDYKGESTIFRRQKHFHDGCYTEWIKGDINARPNNFWWKTEAFDVSSDVSYSEVQFKFKIKKGSAIGTSFAWGWLIDNFELIASTAPINPPTVRLQPPYLKNYVSTSDIYTVFAKIVSRSTAPLHTPLLYITYVTPDSIVSYDTLQMNPYEGDSLWKANILRRLVSGTSVSYKIMATDTDGYYSIDYSSFKTQTMPPVVQLISPFVKGIVPISDTYTIFAKVVKRTKYTLPAPLLYLRYVTSDSIFHDTLQMNPYEGDSLWKTVISKKMESGTKVYYTVFATDTSGVSATDTMGFYATDSSAFTIHSPLHGGKYTVGPHGQFTDIKEVTDILKICGATGNVTLLLESGMHKGALTIRKPSAIFPDSYNLTITSATGNAADATLYGDKSDRPAILLSNVRNVTLQNLTIQSCGDGIVANDTACDIKITGCRLLLDTIGLTNSFCGVAVTNSVADRVFLTNNEIVGGCYSIRIDGKSSTEQIRHVTVSGNEMRIPYYYGLYSNYVDFDSVTGNVVTNRYLYYEFIGMSFTQSTEEKVCGNKIHANANSTRGLYLSFFNADSNRAGIFANNEVILKSGALSYGLELNNSNAEFAHNSIIILGMPPTCAGVLCSVYNGYKVKFFKNNFTGYYAMPFNILNPKAIGKELFLDYNNYYGITYIGYANGFYNNVSDWIAASKDTHAVSVRPAYMDSTQSAACFHYKGMVCPTSDGMEKDIQGWPRGDSTAIGCYAPIWFDATLLSFEEWKSSVEYNRHVPVKVHLSNYGLIAPLLELNINWAVNGVAQTPFLWKGNLAPFHDTVLEIGNYFPFDGINNVVVWLSGQNGSQTGDLLPTNDTIRNISYCCKEYMHGTYRVGQSMNADFKDLNAAITRLYKCGMNGPVVLQLEDGTYPSFSILDSCFGISSNNTLTITSLSGNAADVVFKGGPYVVDIYSSHFRLERVTVDGRTEMSKCGVRIPEDASDIRISGCNIYMDSTSTSNDIYGIWCVRNHQRDNIQIMNNHVDGGYYGIFFHNGTSSAYKGGFHRIDSNIITNSCCYGIYSYFSNLESCSYNVCSARNRNGSLSYYGIYSFYSYINNLSCNRIDAFRDYLTRCYGLDIENAYPTAQNNNDILIINNEIRTSAKNNVYGVLFSGGNSIMAYNSVYAITAGTTGYGIYAYNKSCLINNNIIFGGANTGYPVYMKTTSDNMELSGNNYYGTIYLLYNSTNRYTLSDLLKYDAAASNTMPNFIDIYKDLQIRSDKDTSMQCQASSFSAATTDINGVARHSITAKGCHNFLNMEYSAALTGFKANTACPTGNKQSVIVSLYNRGDSALTDANLYWEVNGVAQQYFKWTGKLSAESTVQVKIGEFTVTRGMNHLKAYVSLNGHTDAITDDDTVYTTVFGCKNTALQGYYTVGSPNDSFPTLEDALNTVSKCGIAGAVTLALADGIYGDIHLTGPFPGVNDTNIVTITSANGRRDGVVITSPVFANAVTLDNISHLHFTSITIGDTAFTKNGVVFQGTIDDVKFYDCCIYSTLGSSDNKFSAIRRDEPKTILMNRVCFKKCLIRGGYSNIYMTNAGKANNYGHLTIDSCDLLDAYYAGYFAENVYCVLSACHNYIHNSPNSINYNGFRFGSYISYQNIDSLMCNRIWCNCSGINCGIFLGNMVNYNNKAQGQALIWNNEIVVDSGSNNSGISYYGYACLDIRHNTLYVKGTSLDGFDNNNLTLNFYNNLVYSVGGFPHGYPGNVSDLAGSWLSMDYNVYYNENKEFIISGLYGFPQWVSTVKKDNNSMFKKVSFIDAKNHNFHTNGEFGIPVDTTVLYDLAGKKRRFHTNAGCYHDFAFDGLLECFVAPQKYNTCVPNYSQVKIGLYNAESYDINFSNTPAIIYLSCESDSLNFVISLRLDTGSLSSLQRDTIDIHSALDITYPGIYRLKAWLDWAQNVKRDDDTLRLDYYVEKTMLPYDNNFTGEFTGVIMEQLYGNIGWKATSNNPVLNPVYGTGSLLFSSSKARGSIGQVLFNSVSLQGTYNPHLYFWYAHDNANPHLFDQMDVCISQDGGATFKTIQTIHRYDAQYTQPTWKEYKIDLSNYSTGSCIIIAFIAYSYGGGDQTIDRVKIIAQQDMRVQADVPSDTDFTACNLTNHSLTVYLENMTGQIISFNIGDSITLEMSGPSNLVLKQALKGHLNGKEIDTLVFGPIDYIGSGKFDILVYVNSIDSNTLNDTTRFSIVLNPDLAVTGHNQIGYTNPGDTVYVDITLNNVGNLEIISPFDVSIALNGNSIVTEQVSHPLKVGDTLHYRFRQGIVVPMISTDQPYYLLEVRTGLPCDANENNDSINIIGNVNIIENGILSIFNPLPEQCDIGGNLANVEVRLFNIGTVDNKDSVLLTAVIDSAGVTHAILKEKIAPLYAGENRNHIFKQQYRIPRLSVNGAQANYNVVVFLNALNGDFNLNNDTAQIEACVQGGVNVKNMENTKWMVGQNMPNPASGMTMIPYSIPEADVLTLCIMNMNGQMLFCKEVDAGTGTGVISVNISDLSSGIYYYCVTYRGERIVKKMNIMH